MHGLHHSPATATIELTQWLWLHSCWTLQHGAI